jgi:hypothetical protein
MGVSMTGVFIVDAFPSTMGVSTTGVFDVDDPSTNAVLDKSSYPSSPGYKYRCALGLKIALKLELIGLAGSHRGSYGRGPCCAVGAGDWLFGKYPPNPSPARSRCLFGSIGTRMPDRLGCPSGWPSTYPFIMLAAFGYSDTTETVHRSSKKYEN